jgi:5'(3')-deoxyribonucleotidase
VNWWTAPWNNPSAWSDKLEWVQKYLGDVAEKRLILTHHKYLVQGDVLIDDRRKRGAGAFSGYHMHFGHDHETGKPNTFPTWESVLAEIKKITWRGQASTRRNTHDR